ncbi:MAG: hypothetical protein AAGB04_00355 [Pseudomonadota bacterium]
MASNMELLPSGERLMVLQVGITDTGTMKVNVDGVTMPIERVGEGRYRIKTSQYDNTLVAIYARKLMELAIDAECAWEESGYADTLDILDDDIAEAAELKL